MRYETMRKLVAGWVEDYAALSVFERRVRHALTVRQILLRRTFHPLAEKWHRRIAEDQVYRENVLRHR